MTIGLVNRELIGSMKFPKGLKEPQGPWGVESNR